MTTTGYLKSRKIIVLPQLGKPGLSLIHSDTGYAELLDEDTARSWLQWDNHGQFLIDRRPLAQRLLGEGLVLQRRTSRKGLPEAPCDMSAPVLAGVNAKWLAESPELYVLFNSSLMRRNNPLLVLNPCASLCWREILKGSSLRDIRSKAYQVFGVDDVLPFLKRLIDMGFLAEIPELTGTQTAAPPEMEFHAPHIQQQARPGTAGRKHAQDGRMGPLPANSQYERDSRNHGHC